MSLFYHAFLNEMNQAYKKSKLSLREFLDIKASLIYKDYEISTNSLYWALNIDKFFEDIKESIEPESTLAKKILKENEVDWINQDLGYLKKRPTLPDIDFDFD